MRHIATYLVFEAFVVLLCALFMHFMLSHAVSARNRRRISLTWVGVWMFISSMVLALSIINWRDHYPAGTQRHMSPGLDHHLSMVSLAGALLGFAIARLGFYMANLERERFNHRQEQAQKRRKAMEQMPPVPEPDELFVWTDNWGETPQPV